MPSNLLTLTEHITDGGNNEHYRAKKETPRHQKEVLNDQTYIG